MPVQPKLQERDLPELVAFERRLVIVRRREEHLHIPRIEHGAALDPLGG
jgi:hypothetical protein